MRRLRFQASASETVQGSTALAWSWADRLPEALTEFAFVSEVRAGATPDAFTLLLGPVGYGKVSMTLEMAMSVFKEPGRTIRLQSHAGTGNADATVSVDIKTSTSADTCLLTIALDVSPHTPASAFWPREWIEKVSSASLQLAARKMLKDMKTAIESGAAEALRTQQKELPSGAVSATVDRRAVASALQTSSR